MNDRSHPKRILVAFGACLLVLVSVLVMVLGHLTPWAASNKSVEMSNTSNLIYSGSTAAAVAALLVVLFFALRTGKGDSGEGADDSEEEFEETEVIEEGPPKNIKP